MASLAPGELKRFNAQPIENVEYHRDLDYVGDGIRHHRLDVIVPRDVPGPLPVYVYFHGGGWTSGDKATLTRYCASQAVDGMVVVNVNYRMAPKFRMAEMMTDANAATAWIAEHIAEFGGDPEKVVLGGDSAGGQLSALLAAASTQPELAAHYKIRPALAGIRGVVQHCSAVDFSVIFERGFILGMGFVRMLIPARFDGSLKQASRYLSPIEWVHPDYPPVLVTTSRVDPFYRANLNFIKELRRHKVDVDVHVDDDAQHTWQQDSRHPASHEVYGLLQSFVRRVASREAVSP